MHARDRIYADAQPVPASDEYAHVLTQRLAVADAVTFREREPHAIADADAESVVDGDAVSLAEPHTSTTHAHSLSHAHATTAHSYTDAIAFTSATHALAHAMTSASMHEHEKYAGIYASAEKYPRYGHSNHGSRAMPLLSKWAPASLVDVGCGWNEFCQAARAAIHGIYAIGVDFACPGADVAACATALPFPDKRFDVLTCFDMLEHLLPEQVDAALAEFARVSRRFIFSIAHEASVTKWKGENLHPTVRGEPWWILRILRAGGCRIERRGRYLTGEWQPALRIDPGARVILVGNGPSVLAHQGEVIDAFDEIVRFNTYHLDGFEGHTGARTTLWSTFGRGQLPGCAQRPDRVIHIHGEDAEAAYAPRELYRIPRWFYNETRRHVQQRAWWKDGFERDPSPLLATSGLLVAAWLLQVVGVKTLTLAGFDHFSKELSKQHHYWISQSFGKPKEHHGEVEAAVFDELRQNGRITYLQPGPRS